MILRRTFDHQLVAAVMGDPAVYPTVSDDGSPLPGELANAGMAGGVDDYALAALGPNGNLMGVVLFTKRGFIHYEMHTALLKPFQSRAYFILRRAMKWMFDNTPCRKITTLVDADNVRLAQLAEHGGFTHEGTLRATLLRGGRLHDEHVYGMTDEEY